MQKSNTKFIRLGDQALPIASGGVFAGVVIAYNIRVAVTSGDLMINDFYVFCGFSILTILAIIARMAVVLDNQGEFANRPYFAEYLRTASFMPVTFFTAYFLSHVLIVMFR